MAHRRGGRFGRVAWIGSLLLLLLVGLLAACGRGPAPEEGKVPVAVSIAPVADLVARVGGERVQVEVMVPPGTSPHAYEPTPAQIAYLSRARLLVLVGLGLEFWAEKAVAAADNPNLWVEVVGPVTDLLPLPEGVVEAEGTAEEGVAWDPHVWLDPQNAVRIVRVVARALGDVDPVGRDGYQARAEALIQEIQALDEEMAARFEALPPERRRYVATHPAWGYLNRRYGLETVGVLEPTPGREPSPAELAALAERMRELGVRVVVAETQLSPRLAEALAREVDGIVVQLDPLGGTPGREGYLELMEYNLRTLLEALEEAGP